MATKQIHGRIQLKRDTSANWTAENPVLLNGEEILVDTANGEVRRKIGDGVKTYTQLPFEDEAVRNLIGDRVATSQGAENAGKVMGVDENGNIVPMDAPSGSATWGDLAGANT